MEVRLVDDGDDPLARLANMAEFYEEPEPEPELIIADGGPATGALSVARDRWAGASAGAVWAAGRDGAGGADGAGEDQDLDWVPRPLPAVEHASPTLESWLRRRKDSALTLHSRVAGVRSVGGGDTWYELGVDCTNLPANAARADFGAACRELPPLDVSATVQALCTGLPSLDEERYEVGVACANLPPLEEGRFRLTLACSSLPPVQDPRFELYFRTSELRAPESAERRDVMLVVRSVPTSQDERPVEIGRTEVVVPSANPREPVVFEESVTIPWNAEGQQLQIVAYFASAAEAEGRDAPLDLLLDCELGGSTTFDVQTLAEDGEKGVVKLKMVSSAGDAANTAALKGSRLYGEPPPAPPTSNAAVYVSVGAEDEVAGCAVAVVHSVDEDGGLTEVGRTEVAAAGISPRFDTSVTLTSATAETTLQFDVYHAPLHAVNRPGDAIDVNRGCAYLGSSRCQLEDLIGPDAESLELADGRGADGLHRRRLRTVEREGSLITVGGTAAASGVGAPIVVISTVENDALAEVLTEQGRTEAVAPTPDPAFKGTADVVSKFRRAQMVRFDIYYADPVAAGVEEESPEKLALKLVEAIESRGLPPDSTWKDIKKFDKELKKSETKKDRKERKKREKAERKALRARQGKLNIRADCEFVGSAECWLGALVQSMDSDDKQLEMKVTNKLDDELSTKLRRGKTSLTVTCQAEPMKVGAALVVAHKVRRDPDDDDMPPVEEEIGRTETAKAGKKDPKFKTKLSTTWAYDPSERFIFRVYFARDDEEDGPPPEPSETPSDSDFDETETSTVEESFGDYIGSAWCSGEDLMEKCSDGGLNLTLTNELSDMMQHRLKDTRLTLKCKRKAVSVQYGAPLVIVRTDQEEEGVFAEVCRTEVSDTRGTELSFAEALPLEVELGAAFQPRVRFDLVYVHEDPEDEVSCDPDWDLADGCEYVGSAMYDLETLFSAGELELVLRNKKNDIWDTRISDSRLTIAPADLHWSLGSPCVVISGVGPLTETETGESITTMWELGRTETVPLSRDASFAARIPLSYDGECSELQLDVLYVNDDARQKSRTELQVPDDCERVASVRMGMDALVAGQNALFSVYNVATGVKRQLRNGEDEEMDSRLVTLRSTINVCAKKRMHRKATMHLKLCAKDLATLDSTGNINPFLCLSRERLSSSWKNADVIHRTERVVGDFHPKWLDFTLDLRTLCDDDLGAVIVLSVFDWDKDGAHDLIGLVEMTVTQLYQLSQGAEGVPLAHPQIDTHKPGNLICQKATIARLGGGDGATPPLEKVYAPVSWNLLRVKSSTRKPMRTMLLDHLGARILDGGKTETLFAYQRILEMGALTPNTFRIVAENSKGHEIQGDFEYEELPSETLLALIQARIDYLKTGELPPCYEKAALNVTSGDLGWDVLSMPTLGQRTCDMTLAATARRGIPRALATDTEEQQRHQRWAKAVVQIQTRREKPLRRATLKPWGRWPHRTHKGRRQLAIASKKLPMPKMPTGDGASGLLRKERRQQAIAVAEWIVVSAADSAVGFIEGRENAAVMLADRALEIAMLEYREEIAADMVHLCIDQACNFGEACTVACAATVESMVTELEVVEVMDRLLERVELDAHYREMRETSSVPPLATLALRASLMAGAEGAVHTILQNPVLLETLRDPTMLPFLTQLLMHSSNHRALHVAPEPMKFDRFITLHEDEFGHLSGHHVLTARMLTVRVVEAKGLAKMDLLSAADPFAVVSCGEDEFSTEVISNSNAPNWDEEFHFRCYGQGVLLKLFLYDHDVASKDDPMGMVEVCLDDIPRAQLVDEWFLLEPVEGCAVPSGEVRLAIRWTKLPEGTVTDSEHWEVQGLHLDRETGELDLTQRYGNGSFTTWSAKTFPMASALVDGIWSGSIGGTFTAFRTPTGRKLTVRVIEARGLKKMDRSGAADPFVVVKCGSQQFRTEVEFDTKRPHWDKEFTFKVLPLGGTLVVELYDFDRESANDAMGQVVIPLAHIQPHAEGTTAWHPLIEMKGVNGLDAVGDVRLAITCPYALSPRMLMVSVVAAKQLPKLDGVSSLNPYAVVQCEHSEHKTATMHAEHDPKWNEHFEFDVLNTSASVRITVMDHNKVAHDAPMGQVVASLAGLSPLGDGLDEWFRLKPMPGATMPQGEVHLRIRWTYDLDEVQQPLADSILAPPDDPHIPLVADPDFEPDKDTRVFVIAVLEAQDLKKMDRFGHNDVYVKARLDFEKPPEPEPEDEGSDAEPEPEPEEDVDGPPEAAEYKSSFDTSEEPEPEPEAVLEKDEKEKGGTEEGGPEPEPEPEAEAEAEAAPLAKPVPKTTKWKQTATIVKGGEAPKWATSDLPDGAELIFVGQTRVPEKVEIEVYDEDIGTDDLIGRAELVLGEEDYKFDQPPAHDDWQLDEWVQLTGKIKKGAPEETGKLHVMGKWVVPEPEPELPKERLYVTVYECAELPKMDRFGDNDVYVKIRTAAQGKQTSVVNGGGTDPKWGAETGEVKGQTFMLTVSSLPGDITFQVFDQDVGKSELIGRGALSLATQSPNDEFTITKWVEIADKKDRPTGKAKIGVKWAVPVSRTNDDGRQLHVTVFSATKLKKMDLFGENDVYCSVHVGSKMKRTTTIEGGGANVSWGGAAGETSTFVLLDECPTHVEVRVFDEDVGSADDLIGVAFLDFEEQDASADWTIDKVMPLVDKKGEQFTPASLIKLRASWRKPPPVRPGRLYATCIQASQLPNADGRFGKNDVYVEVGARNVFKRTHTVKDGGTAPVWNDDKGERLKFTLRDMPQSLEVRCMDEDVASSDDLIGRATVPLDSMPTGNPWELDRWLPLRDAKGEEAGMAHLLFRWKPHPLEDSEPEEPYHLSGVWHAVGAERRTNRPLAPPFLTQPPVAYMNALKMLLVAESVLCASVVAEALMDPENTTVFQLLFRFPMAVDYQDDENEEEFLREAFFAVDTDRSGIIDREEFTQLCLRLDENMSPQDIEDAILRVDTDGDEEITLDEFKAWWIREDLKSAAGGQTGLKMAELKEQMRLLVADETATESPGAGSRWRCVRKAPVQAGVDIYSDETGFVEEGEVIEAIDAQVLEGGHLRILFYRGWTSTKPTDSLGGVNYSEDDAQSMFDEMDDDFSGALDEDEVRELCKKLGRKLNKKSLAAAMAEMDDDGNGTVEWEEFWTWWQANVNLFVQTEDTPTADPWTVAKMRHKRDTEEAEEVRREAHVELEDRKRRHVTTNRAIRAEKDILSDAEAALIAATQAIEQHEEEFGMSEPRKLKELKQQVEDITTAVEARQGLVRILRAQLELIQKGTENTEQLEALAQQTTELEPGLRIKWQNENASDETAAAEAAESGRWQDDITEKMRTGTSKEEAEDHDALDSDSVAPDNDDLETVETQSNDEPPDRDVNALDVTAETEADDESDEEYELLPRLPDFTHLGLPDRSPMWWGTYCKSVATILERYEQQAVVRLSKRNILWLFSQLHLVTVTTVLTTPACLKSILRYRLTHLLVHMLDGKRRIWSGAHCKLVYTARAVDPNIVRSSSEILRAMLRFGTIALDEHQVARLITMGILPDSDPDLAGPVLTLLTRILLSNMHEGIGRLITPRDGTTKSIILEFLTNHSEVLYILRTRLRSASVKIGPGGRPQLGYIRFAMVELVCAIAWHRYYVFRMVKQGLFESCVDLFFWFPWHSVLHAVVSTAVQKALKAAATEDRMDLLVSTRLIDRVCAAGKNMATVDFRATRPGYSGHIWDICNEILNISFNDGEVASLLNAHGDWQWLISHDLLAANALSRDDWNGFQHIQNTVQTAAAGLYEEEQSQRSTAYDIGPGYRATAHTGGFREAHDVEDVVGWCPSTSGEIKVLLPGDSVAAESLRVGRYRDRPPPQKAEENSSTLAIIESDHIAQEQEALTVVETAITASDGGSRIATRSHPTRRGMSYARSMQMDALKASRRIKAADAQHNTSFLVAPLLNSRMGEGATDSVWNTGRMASRSALLGDSLTQLRPLREEATSYAAAAKAAHKGKKKPARRPHLLRVRVVAGRALAKMDRGGSDPFCVVHYGKEKFETAVVKNELEPVWEPLWEEGIWEHEMQFRLAERVPLKMPLLVEMYDKDALSKNDPMGKVEVPLTELLTKEKGGPGGTGSLAGWFPLRRMDGVKKRPQGEVHLSIHIDWGQRPLKVEVLEARDLPALDHSGTSDPFAKLSCFDQHFQTEVVKKTLTPKWNEEFEFSVVDFSPTANLYVEVFDQDRIVHDDPMGRVIIPIDSIPGLPEEKKKKKKKKKGSKSKADDAEDNQDNSHEAWFPLTWLVMLDDAEDVEQAEASNAEATAQHEADAEEEADSADASDEDAGGTSWPPDNAASDSGSDEDEGEEAKDGEDDQAEGVGADAEGPAAAAAARGEVRLRLTWLPTEAELAAAEQKKNQAAAHRASSPPGSPVRTGKPTRQQLPRLCAALLHSITEDDAPGVVGLIRAHPDLLRFACGLPVDGVATMGLAAELLSLTSRPGLAKLDDEAPAVATPLHIAARCAASTAMDALLRCAELAQPPIKLLERRDPEGRTPLHCAASVASTGACQVLLEWGANVLSFDFSRKLAVDYAEASELDGLRQRGLERYHAAHPSRSCAKFLYDVTTDAATDGRPYAIIEGRLFGNRQPKVTGEIGTADSIVWDYNGSGTRGQKEVDEAEEDEDPDEAAVRDMLTSPVKIYEGAGGDKTNGYFVPTAALVPDPINLGHGGRKGEGAPEGTRQNAFEELKDKIGLGVSRLAKGEGEQSGVCSVQ